MSNASRRGTRRWRQRLTITVVAGLFGFLGGVLPATTASASASRWAPSTPLGALQATVQDPTRMANAYFGFVAMSGTTAVVGADGADSNAGAVYIYVKGTTHWPTMPTVTLHDPVAAAHDGFGASVAVSGSTIVVGAFGTNSYTGAAYVYVKGAAGWPTTPTVTLQDPAAATNDYFGSSVAVSGSTVVVSSSSSSQAGSAYVYIEAASGWPTTPTTTLLDPGGLSSDYFGWSAAMSSSMLVVGAFGASSNAGAAYVYVKDTAGWPTTPTVTLQNPTPAATVWYGFATAVSGTTAVVGADCDLTCAATAFVYLKSGGRWQTTPAATLHLAGSNGSEFGVGVAVSGSTIVAGAYTANSNTGEAYLYVKGTAGWPTTPTATLQNPATAADDDFGFVAVSGTTAVVGAPGASSFGAVYFYKA